MESRWTVEECGTEGFWFLWVNRCEANFDERDMKVERK